MSIVKNTPHILKHSGLSFTTLLNKTLEAIKDPATMGIYVYLASKPSDWDISETNLQNRFGKGRDFIRARLAELKLIGLLKSVAIKGRDGRIIRWETILFSEVQVTENPSSGEDVHITENPPSGETRGLVDPPTTNKRSKQIKDINKPPISPTGGSERFDEFWDMYPVKAAKKACLAKWKRRNLDLVSEMILDKLYQQIHNDETWIKGYPPNPLTYINQDRWDDEIRLNKPSVTPIDQGFDHDDTSWADSVTQDVL